MSNNNRMEHGMNHTTIKLLTCVLVLFASTLSADIDLEIKAGEVRYFEGDVFTLKLDLVIDRYSEFTGDVWLAMMNPDREVFFAPDWTDEQKPLFSGVPFPTKIELEDVLLLKSKIPSAGIPIDAEGDYFFAFGISISGTSDFIAISTCSMKYMGEREWMVIDDKDGINHGIAFIIEDRQGGYWFGHWGSPTDVYYHYHYKNGVIKKYGAAEGLGKSIQKDGAVYDSQGRLWIGGSMGLGLYKPEEDSFQVFQPPENRLVMVYSLAYEDEDIIWLGALHGLWRFDIKTETWLSFSEDNDEFNDQVRDIKFDSEGNLWLAGYYDYGYEGNKGLVRKFDGEKYEYFKQPDFFSPDDVAFESLGIYPEGNIWVSSLYSFKGYNYRYSNGTWENPPDNFGLQARGKIMDFNLDRFGKFWCSYFHETSGNFLYQLKDDRWSPVLPEIYENGIEYIYTIYQDSENNYWFGCEPNQVIRWGSD